MGGKGFLLVVMLTSGMVFGVWAMTTDNLLEMRDRVILLVKKFQTQYELRNIYSLLVGEYSFGKMPRNQSEFLDFLCENFHAPEGRQCTSDPFGTEYRLINYPGGKIEIRSAGPDRVFWTSDDIFIVIRK